MNCRLWGWIGAVVLLLILPFVLRPAPEERLTIEGADQIVILTPNAESIRYEFERAFREYYREKNQREVTIDWRSPGGSSDIVRYIADRYEAAFRKYYEAQMPDEEFDDEIAAAFANHKLTRENASPREWQARELFLNSDIDIGVDLFFGGGMYDHQRHAARGFSVDGGVMVRHPEYFAEDAILPAFSGETLYLANGGAYGSCLSTFGLCYNPDRIAELGIEPPKSWYDLGKADFLGVLAVADPTKSGSINKCFEMIVQQTMQEAMAHDPEKGAELGWAEGMNLIKRMVGNSSLLADSAGKVTHEVAAGNAAAGMCIDFYAFAEAEWTAFQRDGKASIVYVKPEGGSAVSTDPIQMLRGAPNRKAAEEFLDFVLSIEGQKLWDFKKGVPGGPEKYVIRRPPIRQELYRDEYREFMADPDYNPYAGGAELIYDANLTGRYFNLLRVTIKCIALDVMDELQIAWQAILAAGGPDAVPEAMKEFNALPFAYSEASKADAGLYPAADYPMEKVTALRRQWTLQQREHYRNAARLAREGR